MRRRRAITLGGLAVLGAATAGLPAVLRARAAASTGVHELRIATGPPGGVFREIGAALRSVLMARIPGTPIRLIYTDASVENLALLDSAGADLAFAALDCICAGLAAGQPRDVTAVARLFNSWMQVLVPAHSEIRDLRELDGRPVAAGAAGSGTRFTTERLLGVAGVRARLITASQDAGADALATGVAHAWITFTGAPTPAVRRLAKQMRLRMLPLGAAQREMIVQYGQTYESATLPSTMYPNIDGTLTITNPNLLLARPDLPTGLVATVTDALFAELSGIARDHPEANQINIRSAVATMPVRLHPGALRYFRATKPYADAGT
jgi:TRAP transporter TAXI family solute receptor